MFGQKGMRPVRKSIGQFLLRSSRGHYENVRPKQNTPQPQQQSPTLVPQHAQSMHPGDGRERDK